MLCAVLSSSCAAGSLQLAVRCAVEHTHAHAVICDDADVCTYETRLIVIVSSGSCDARVASRVHVHAPPAPVKVANIR